MSIAGITSREHEDVPGQGSSHPQLGCPGPSPHWMMCSGELASSLTRWQHSGEPPCSGSSPTDPAGKGMGEQAPRV